MGDAFIKYLLNQTLGTDRGNVIYGMYLTAKSTNSKVLIATLIQYLLCQALGTVKGSAVYDQIKGQLTNA